MKTIPQDDRYVERIAEIKKLRGSFPRAIKVGLSQATTNFRIKKQADKNLIEALRIGGRTKDVERSIKEGANVNIKTPVTRISGSGLKLGGEAPLHMAVSRGNKESVGMLIKAGAILDIENLEGETPLYKAASEGKTYIVRQLINAGANPNVNTKYGTPLSEAVSRGNIEIVDLLIGEGADPSPEGVHNAFTPIYQAVSEGKEAILGLLIKAGADLNTESARHAFFTAAYNKNPELIDLFIKAGANPNIKDSLGFTPLDRAITIGRTAIVERLIEAGANVNTKSKLGTTPLSRAMKIGNEAIVDLLKKAGAK